MDTPLPRSRGRLRAATTGAAEWGGLHAALQSALTGTRGGLASANLSRRRARTSTHIKLQPPPASHTDATELCGRRAAPLEPHPDGRHQPREHCRHHRSAGERARKGPEHQTARLEPSDASITARRSLHKILCFQSSRLECKAF
ncbi:hypothetical protein AAFF_G00032100 [Aldrovandia affinis]|uniref:Uncharacterized protein n=1 Tax=Aldrovandia affinis TaxID=143900 RepID=A0AAD7S3W9_9TELE|nr:hypothetical protein AAFF_G00032100 [Aldrovandia affinis]